MEITLDRGLKLALGQLNMDRQRKHLSGLEREELQHAVAAIEYARKILTESGLASTKIDMAQF